MDDEELAQLHKALSVPVRLQILKLIADRPLCVNAITGCLKISQPAVSQHLTVLKHAGLVRGDRHGYMVHYSLNSTRLQELREAMSLFPSQEISVPSATEEKASNGHAAGLEGR